MVLFCSGKQHQWGQSILALAEKLSVAKLVGNESQVHGTEDILNAVTGGQLGNESAEKGRTFGLGEHWSRFASELRTCVRLVDE